jgi:hypothetical protein
MTPTLCEVVVILSLGLMLAMNGCSACVERDVAQLNAQRAQAELAEAKARAELAEAELAEAKTRAEIREITEATP